MSDHHHLPEELLSALLDGELTPTEQAELKLRLEASIELREELEALREVSQQVRMLPRPYAPPELRKNVLEQIQKKRTPDQTPVRNSTSRKFWQKIAGWSATGIAASLLLLAGWSLSPPPDQKQTLALQEPPFQTAPVAPVGVNHSMATRESVHHQMASPNLALPPHPEAASAPLPPESVQIVNVSRDEIRRKINELDHRPQQGNSLRVPGSLTEQDGETPIVVIFTVVDVMEAMNQMQVLVRQQQIRSADNQVLSVLPRNPEGRSMTAVAVELEMDGREMAAVLNSVAAVDAVMYVEKETATAPPHSPAPTPAPEMADALMTGRSPESTRRKTGSPPQRQFNFQQLAEPAMEPPQGPGPMAKAAIAGKRHSGNSAEGGPSGSASSAQALSQAAPDRAGLSSKPLTRQVPAESPSWEDIRRFRALILLKPQTEQPAKPDVRTSP